MFTLSMLHTTNANTVTNRIRYRLGAPRQSVVTSLDDCGNVNSHPSASSSSGSPPFPSPAVDDPDDVLATMASFLSRRSALAHVAIDRRSHAARARRAASMNVDGNRLLPLSASSMNRGACDAARVVVVARRAETRHAVVRDARAVTARPTRARAVTARAIRSASVVTDGFLIGARVDARESSRARGRRRRTTADGRWTSNAAPIRARRFARLSSRRETTVPTLTPRQRHFVARRRRRRAPSDRHVTR